MRERPRRGKRWEGKSKENKVKIHFYNNGWPTNNGDFIAWKILTLFWLVEY